MEIIDDWELLVYAQHFGMATRLLDWTSNPFAGLWFACENPGIDGKVYFYLLLAELDQFVDRIASPSPFNGAQTRILRPPLNNTRIVAQNGLFTAHQYAAGEFVPLNVDPNFKDALFEFEINDNIRSELLLKLNQFGVNSATIYPDLTGLCSHITWEHTT